MGNLKEKWQNLSAREQVYIVIAGILLIVTILYYGVISPLLNGVDDVKQRLHAQQTLSTWMTPRVAALSRISNTTPSHPVTAANLLATVDTQLKQSNFAGAIGEISQTNTNQVHVTLKEVAFDDLMAWLVQQWQQSQIQISDFDAQKTDKPGMVSVTMTLMVN
jgi:general secretion pathway protein M